MSLLEIYSKGYIIIKNKIFRSENVQCSIVHNIELEIKT